MVVHRPGVPGPFGLAGSIPAAGVGKKEKMKSFNEKCYEILRKVPKGKVTTYKALAEKLNSRAYRYIGRLMNKNPHGFVGGGDIPCHRVIGSDGSLVGFAHGLRKKSEMLKKEGVEVTHGRVDLKKYGFKFK